MSSIITLSQGKRIAKKEHQDSSWEHIHERFLSYRPLIKTGLSFTELRAIARLKANKGKILAGQEYSWQNNIFDNHHYTWKSLPEIEKICWKHDIYPVDDWA